MLYPKEIAAEILDVGSVHWHFLLKKKIIIFGQNLSSDPQKRKWMHFCFFLMLYP